MYTGDTSEVSTSLWYYGPSASWQCRLFTPLMPLTYLWYRKPSNKWPKTCHPSHFSKCTRIPQTRTTKTRKSTTIDRWTDNYIHTRTRTNIILELQRAALLFVKTLGEHPTRQSTFAYEIQQKYDSACHVRKTVIDTRETVEHTTRTVQR